jgi:hypothetical protein
MRAEADHNVLWRLFVGRRLGRLEGLTVPQEDDRQGQLLFGAANFLGLLLIIMLLSTIPALAAPGFFAALLLAIALAALTRGVIAIIYYRHLRAWKSFALYSASVVVLAAVLYVLLLR